MAHRDAQPHECPGEPAVVELLGVRTHRRRDRDRSRVALAPLVALARDRCIGRVHRVVGGQPENRVLGVTDCAAVAARPPDKIHPEDRPVEVGDATAIVLGMGRVGRATCAQLGEEHGYKVLGVEHDPQRVHALQEQGVNIVEGDATDYDFWTRVVRTGLIEIIVLAMPSQHANIDALRELRRIGYHKATVAAVALYREDVEELEELGVDIVVHLYAGAARPWPTEPPRPGSHRARRKPEDDDAGRRQLISLLP